jgi:hypothetical protein
MRTNEDYKTYDLKKIYDTFDQWAVGNKTSDEVSAAINPELLSDGQILKKPDRYGTTLLHILANIGELGRLPTPVLDKDALLIRDFSGQTVAASAAASGNFATIPTVLLDNEVLTNPPILPLVHRLAINRELHKIPASLLTVDVILSTDNKGLNVAHSIANTGFKGGLNQIPKHLLDDTILLSKDRNGRTPLDYIAEHGNFEDIPTKYLSEEILFPNQGKTHGLLDSVISGSIDRKEYDFYKKILKFLSDKTIRILIKTQRGTDILELAQKEDTKRRIKKLSREEDFCL